MPEDDDTWYYYLVHSSIPLFLNTNSNSNSVMIVSLETLSTRVAHQCMVRPCKSTHGHRVLLGKTGYYQNRIYSSLDDFMEEEDGPSPEEIARRIRQETDDIVFEQDPPDHKMGFIAIIGKPNAGKSTLMNTIIGENLSIVTEKAQTTRHKVLGIWSETGHQAVFLDTPGIIVNQKDELEERMMAAVTQAIKDADVLIAIVDVGDRPEQALEMIQPGDNWDGPPMAVLLNKIDTIDEETYQSIVQWYKDNCKAEIVIPISAETGENVSILKEWVLEKIPEGPSMYPKDVLSEANERFFVSEIIRKNVFLQYRQELPYQVAVQVTEFKERIPPKKTFIQANVVVEKERHVKLLVGSKGSAIKALSLSSRADIEEFLGVPVYLDVSVKVVPKWRSSDTSLSSLGYT